MSAEVLLAPWDGPYGGVPPLDRVDVAMFEPALLAAIDEKRQQARAIRDDPAPPTFSGTVEALERMGATLERVTDVYDLWSSNFSTPAFRDVKHRMEPKIAEIRDLVRQDGILFAKVKAVAADPSLTVEQARVCAEWLSDFERAGAHLDQAGRDRVMAINQRLAVLYNDFSDRLLADEEAWVTWLDASQLGGLPEGWVAAAKIAAEELGRPEAWAVTNTRSSVEPFLQYSTERDLRERVWRIFFKRGDNGDANDTVALIPEILALRLERARLIGYETHAHMQLSDTMARTPEAATALMRQIWEAASARFRAEVAEMQALADERGDGITIARWDVRFYAEEIRKARYDFDPAELLQHYELERLVEGMFWAATERFGWGFERIRVPLPHPDMSAWVVKNADGSPRGLFYLDPYARRGKRSGAWMTAYRTQQRLAGHIPIVSNNCNFQKPPAGQPCLLTTDEARTLFHEFGHAMHGLASDVTYPKLAGTNVPRDYVEFPSQLNEHWLTTTELLARFALHHTTGEPPSAALLERMRAAANADSGFRTMEFLASAVMDMEMHLCTAPIDPRAFEDRVLAEWGLPAEVVMRHRTPQFAHVFSGESYSAGYYSYLWADVLVADAAEAFAEQGYYDVPLSKRLLDTVLSRGNTVDPAEGFRQFRGRDPEVGALLRERGLVPA
ncbi:MAG: M3 family metallopeptidase [Alphaproteobacteria bacterium]|nr:M3 family metallopeptidase [Alphaproteobacteria bacterium]